MSTPDPAQTAVRMAAKPPNKKHAAEHVRCVYANFSDYFLSYESFVAEVVRQKKRQESERN